MCFDRCLKGRAGKCCFGCSTRLGIHLIGMLALSEFGLIGYLFYNELGEGLFNMMVFTWLFLSGMRAVAYISMCCDSISKRKCYVVTLFTTTLLELIIFTISNMFLFNGDSNELVLRIVTTWGISETM